MKYTISNRDGGIHIDVTGVRDGSEQLIDAFTKCREGRCSCPTQEYEKVEAIEIQQSGESIHVSIRVREGEIIETGDIEQCLQHTGRGVSGDGV